MFLYLFFYDSRDSYIKEIDKENAVFDQQQFPSYPFYGQQILSVMFCILLIVKKTHEKTKANNVNIYFQFLKTDLKKKQFPQTTGFCSF